MKKSQKKITVEDLFIPEDPSFPSTHFFYEYDGEREVSAGEMVEHAMLLWHEQMLNTPLDDISHLWGFAAFLLEQDEPPTISSKLEWLRYRILVGGLTPDSWMSLKPYPYKGMLIAAIYLQEARRLCHEDPSNRIWHLLSMAYYNLGLNSRPSASKIFAYYSTKNQAEDSEHKRAYVIKILEKIQGDPRITSIEKAKDAVIDFILKEKNHKGGLALLAELEKLDYYTPEGSKHNKQNTALDRLRNTLDDWARPSGPYPQVAEAFAAFRQKRAGAISSSSAHSTASQASRSTSENVEIAAEDFHMRFFFTRTDEFEIVQHISKGKKK